MGTRSSTAVDAHVGARIRLRRMLIGMSQEKLGDALGVTFQQVQKYEKGSNRISASKLYEVAGKLGVPVSHFFDGLADSAQPTDSLASAEDMPIMEFVRSPEGLALNRAFAVIENGTTRKCIVELVRALDGQN